MLRDAVAAIEARLAAAWGAAERRSIDWPLSLFVGCVADARSSPSGPARPAIPPAAPDAR